MNVCPTPVSSFNYADCANCLLFVVVEVAVRCLGHVKKSDWSIAYSMCVDGSQQVSVQYWQLIDKIIQQVALQTKEGNPDVAPLDVDVRKLLKQFVCFFIPSDFDYSYCSFLLRAAKCILWPFCPSIIVFPYVGK